LRLTTPSSPKEAWDDFKKSLRQIDSSLGKMTVEELLKKFQASLKKLDKNTIQKLGFVAQHLRDKWAPGMNQAVRKVKTSEVDAWLGLIRAEYAISYYNEHVQFVRRMFDLAVADKVLADSPAKDAKTVKRATPIRQSPNWEQFKAIVEDIRGQSSMLMPKIPLILWTSLVAQAWAILRLQTSNASMSIWRKARSRC
jgi:hypothetical protein